MKLTTVLLAIMIVPGLASAAQIYGSLKEGGNPIGKGVQVQIQYNGGPAQGVTDSYGSYNLYVRPPGKCKFMVYYRGEWVQIDINSYNDPVRYDFDLVRQNDGHYMLRRR